MQRAGAKASKLPSDEASGAPSVKASEVPGSVPSRAPASAVGAVGSASTGPSQAPWRSLSMRAVAGLEVVHIGRQAIYDSSLHSRAYELFYRARSPADVLQRDAERAACSVVLSAFAELGLERVSSNKPVFLNVSHDVISGALPLPVRAEHTVLQVRDYEHSVGELVAALRARKAEGYQTALEGFVYDVRTAPLVAVADYLKFDVRRLGAEGVAAQLALIGDAPGAPVACQIETAEEFNACVAAGCRYFQGPFLFRPQLLSHQRLPKSLRTLQRLLQRLRDPDVAFSELEGLVKADPALGLALLRLLGSAAYALPQPVSSVLHAITLLGLREFSKWIVVIALASSAERPGELSLMALIRARACELLAQVGGMDGGAAFMVGLLSALEALFERPLASLLDELPVGAEIQAAVLERTGALGQVLTAVLSRESEETLLSAGFDPGSVNRAWLEALSWAEELHGALR